MAQKEEEFKQTIDQLNRVKDEEIKNCKNAWQKKTNELLNEVGLVFFFVVVVVLLIFFILKDIRIKTSSK
jgi:hypothetical protein